MTSKWLDTGWVKSYGAVEVINIKFLMAGMGCLGKVGSNTT